ncbi:MAG: hypothetical protein PHV34_02495 [Verrucomicrobiae bacterium]|nr:hypothetical protein [Verrucomicrobiae bacterium]
MKTPLLLIAIMSFAVSGILAAGGDGENLIRNPGFEENREGRPSGGWFVYNLEKASRVEVEARGIFRADDLAHSGGFGFTMIGKTNCMHGDLGMEICFHPDTTYRYSAWIKVKDVFLLKFQALHFDYGIGGEIRKGYLVKPVRVASRFLKDVEETCDWTYYETTFRTPRELNAGGINGAIHPIWHFQGIGQVWVDDVELTIAAEK